MLDNRRQAAGVGFLAAALLLAGLFWYVGAAEVFAELADADLGLVALVGAMAVAWLCAWTVVLRTVLGALGQTLSVRDSLLVYAAATFANNVTPFGQAGGEPITALLISDTADVEYERGLATIASTDALNFVPSILLAVLGVAYYATQVGLTGRLETVATGVLVLAIAAPALLAVGWRYRYTVEASLLGASAPVLARLDAALPWLSPPTPAGVKARIEGFFHAIERIATSPRRLALALGFSAAGWLCQAVGLWVAFRAFGAAIPIYIALFVIPIGTIASASPTPGGLGAIEAVHVLLLTGATPVPASTVAAVVAVHRVGGFLLTTSLGGGAAAYLWSVDRRVEPSAD
ncbi:TIGR00374 family protein [Halarchaeum grantii]|uniref:TIGR00374 family protein n=1 Tax=Halarchaeum grantii TaxID=1193105 RepID=A0A830FBJ9_9EURY|nr:lysylphosphatidylglycerol synthase transmembrane domain-containing protein [Halarchaeum grantii]GGL30372.1 TIGR00374 family protein [Halarchaeum grantii]